MANLQNSNQESFEGQIQAFTIGTVSVLTALSPLVSILATLGVAGAGGYVEYLYLKQVFGQLGVVFAGIETALRFGAGMAGIQLIKQRHYLPALYAIAFSLALTVWFFLHVDAIAGIVNPNNPEAVATMLPVYLFGGFFGELLVASFVATVGKSGNGLPALRLGNLFRMTPAKQNGHATAGSN